MFFVSRQKKIESQLAQYREKVADCVAGFHNAIESYCETSDRDELLENYLSVHGIESQADDIRREIEVMMYSKSVFPESRGDILGLLEAIDKVPNKAEEVLYIVRTHHMIVPAALAPQVLQLADVCHRCVDSMLEAAAKLFTDFTNATAATGKVDELESEADRVEFDLYERIFSSDIDPFDKLLLRDLTKDIASISDRAENVGDRIRIIVSKRNI